MLCITGEKLRELGQLVFEYKKHGMSFREKISSHFTRKWYYIQHKSMCFKSSYKLTLWLL